METKIKYPRTYHLPFSPGRSSDDKVLESSEHLYGKRVVITEKMDGENTTMYRDYVHARSLDSVSHPSQSWVRNFHACIQYIIPEGYRICGENLYAKHSIEYNELPTYFMAFSIWKDQLCLNWTDTVEMAEIIGVSLVPVIYRGEYSEGLERTMRDAFPSCYPDAEGFVVRLEDSFQYDDFDSSVAKYVRAGHVQPNAKHWKTQKVVPNKLK